MRDPHVTPFHAMLFPQDVMRVAGAGVEVGITVDVDDGDAPGESVDVGDDDGEAVGVCVLDALIGIPLIMRLSTERPPDAVPTATATMRQHTVGLFSAVAGIAGERMAVTHEPVGVRGVVTPKGVNAPADPATPYVI